MFGKLDLIECQATLASPISKSSRTNQRAAVVFRTMRDMKHIVWVSTQALHAVPRHVLNGQKRAISR